MGVSVQDSWLQPDIQLINGNPSLATFQPRCHWAGGNVDTEAPVLDRATWFALHNAAGTQSGCRHDESE